MLNFIKSIEETIKKPDKLKRSITQKYRNVEQKVKTAVSDFQTEQQQRQQAIAERYHCPPLQRATIAFQEHFSTGGFVKIQVDGKDETFALDSEQVYYQLHYELGKGGFGSVYKATRLDNQQPVAIKMLNPFHSHGNAQRESNAHKLMGTSGGAPIFGKRGAKHGVVMKYIDGRKLESEYLDPNSEYSPLDLYHQSKNLIQKLHEKGFTHGDTNTGNFLVEKETGLVYLIDYGDCAPVRDLEKRIQDFQKLASNTVDELRYRDDPDAVQASNEALEDFHDTERNCIGFM